MSSKKRLRIVSPAHTATALAPALAPALPPPVLACTRFNNKTWQEYQQWMTTHQQTYEQIYQRPLKCIYGTPREISNKKIPPQARILVIEMNNDENKIEGIGEIINQTASEVYKTVGSGCRPIKFNTLFSDRNYTRYIYIGNTRYASREELERNHTEDAQYINNQLKTLLPATTPNHTTTPSLGGGTPLERNHTEDAQYINNQLEALLPTTTTPTPHHTNHHTTNHTTTTPTPSLGGGTPLERLLFKGARHMKRGSGITRCLFMK